MYIIIIMEFCCIYVVLCVVMWSCGVMYLLYVTKYTTSNVNIKMFFIKMYKMYCKRLKKEATEDEEETERSMSGN